jgi:hypothetical protein
MEHKPKRKDFFTELIAEEVIIIGLLGYSIGWMVTMFFEQFRFLVSLIIASMGITIAMIVRVKIKKSNIRVSDVLILVFGSLMGIIGGYFLSSNLGIIIGGNIGGFIGSIFTALFIFCGTILLGLFGTIISSEIAFWSLN